LGSEIIYHALLFTCCRCLVVSRGKGKTNDMTTVIAGEAEWNRTRAVVVSYLMVLGALMAGYFFYQHAVRYTQSYDVNCAAPGVLVSEIWSADFVMQGLTGLLLVAYLLLGFAMLLFWYNRLFYVFFAGFTVLLFGYQIAVSVYMVVWASRANSCAAVGNPFNDFRICGVCGTFVSWAGYCFGEAPYNPPVTGNLSINTPKSFQLGFNWVFTIFLAFAMLYVPVYYKNSQDVYLTAWHQKPFATSAAAGGASGEDENDAEYGRVHLQRRQQQSQIRNKYSVLK
jgi:hypothetical protein